MVASASRVWDTSDAATEESCKVILVRNGREQSYDFAGDVTLANAVNEVSRQNSLTSVIVKEEDGSVVDSSAGSDLMSEHGTIKIYPKTRRE